jgi:hypothetical protein
MKMKRMKCLMPTCGKPIDIAAPEVKGNYTVSRCANGHLHELRKDDDKDGQLVYVEPGDNQQKR